MLLAWALKAKHVVRSRSTAELILRLVMIDVSQPRRGSLTVNSGNVTQQTRRAGVRRGRKEIGGVALWASLSPFMLVPRRVWYGGAWYGSTLRACGIPW